MQIKNQFRWLILFALIGIVSLLFGGCQTTQPAVVAATGTIFGLEVSQNAASQTPQLKLGYNRAEIAIVSKEKFGDDVANVLMEFNYGGGPSYSIYQRLAVGRTAVQQAGASAMFIKDASGNLSPEAAKQIKDTINAIK